MLASLYDSLGSVNATLKSYAGYWWALVNPAIAYPSANARLLIIKRWQACERQLKDVKPYKRPTREEQDVIMNALGMARGFYRDPFRDALFPYGDYS